MKSRIIMAMLVIAAAGSRAEEPCTLERCVREALAASPDVEAAARRIDGAAAARREARSAFLPQISAVGSWSRTDNPPQAFFMSLNQRQASMERDFNNPADTENFRKSLVGKILLLDGGQRSLNVAMASLGIEAATEMRKAVQNELIHAVTAAFYGALQAREFIRVQDEAIASINESIRAARERIRAGSAVQTDVLNLEVKLAQAREDRIRASNGFELAVAALNTAIGKDLATGTNLPPAGSADVKPVAPAAPAEAAVENRSELRAMQRQNQIALRQLASARRDYLPRLSAFGSLDWDSADFSGNEEHSYMAGAMLEWDLFTGFRRGATADKAKSALAAGMADERKLRSQLRLDLAQAHLRVAESVQRIEVTASGVQSAREAMRITRERYNRQAADNTELLGAQTALTAMEVGAVSARFDYLVAVSNFERAMGTRMSTWNQEDK